MRRRSKPENPVSPAVTVAIVEDNTGLRESLATLINGTPGYCCIGSFPCAEAALAELPNLSPEVVLIDIHLPKMSGVRCVRELRAAGSAARILMLTVFADSDHIFQALKAGASGYLSKRTPPWELLKAIDEVRNGGAPMSSEIAARVVQYFNEKGRDHAAPASPEQTLSPRESEILARLAEGRLYKEIADSLQIS